MHNHEPKITIDQILEYETATRSLFILSLCRFDFFADFFAKRLAATIEKKYKKYERFYYVYNAIK